MMLSRRDLLHMLGGLPLMGRFDWSAFERGQGGLPYVPHNEQTDITPHTPDFGVERPGDHLSAQLRKLQEEVMVLRRSVLAHFGPEWQFPDSPHPQQRVRSLVFGEGLGRLDSEGISLLATDNGVEGYALIPRPLFRDSSEVVISNSVAEANLCSFAIPASTMQESRGLRVRMLGDHVNNAGVGNIVFTFRVKWGGTTFGTGAATRASDAVEYESIFDCDIYQLDTAEQRSASLFYTGGGVQTDTVTGTEDETDELTLVVTGQMDTANANARIRKYYVRVDLI